MKIPTSEIFNILNSFHSNIEYVPTNSEDAFFVLGNNLNLLALAYDSIEFTYDDVDYPDSPDYDYKSHYNKIKNNFPTLGYYNTVSDISKNINSTSIVIGDSIDDLTDIHIEIKTILWLWENTSVANALWQFKNGFDFHWGSHLRNLQVYLLALEKGQ